jgi:hypothetical protein
MESERIVKVHLSTLLLTSFFGLPKIAAAGELALADLIKPIAIQQVKISPDGGKLAVVTIRDGKRVLALMTPRYANVSLEIQYYEKGGHGYYTSGKHGTLYGSAYFPP